MDLCDLTTFNCDKPGVSERWKRWVRSFELYAEGRNITKDKQKRSLMLHCAGNAVQDIFFTLKIEEDTYQAAVNVLTEHFSPNINPMFLNLFQGIDSSTAGLLKPTMVFR